MSKKGKSHILVCLSSSPSNDTLIETAFKLAQQANADFSAVYASTDKNLSLQDQQRLQRHMKKAEQLGAKVAVIYI